MNTQQSTKWPWSLRS